MYHNTKIATCSYCGTRAALVLTGKERHELACSGCGAPLHELKALKMPAPARSKRQAHGYAPPKPGPRPKKRKKTKRKSSMRHFLGEAFDLIEDILD